MEMSVGEEKKFVMKHVFSDVLKMKDFSETFRNKEKHFNVPWRIEIIKNPDQFHAYLQCLKLSGDNDWSIETTINIKVRTNTGTETIVTKRVFSRSRNTREYFILGGKYEKYLVDGNVTIECHVTIHKLFRVLKPNLRIFDDDSAKEFSDVVFIIDNQKFYAHKSYLACHSTYFKSLLFGNFDESKQSEVELKNIDSQIFQKFLELLYGESAVEDDSVEEILQLADMYDSKTAIRRCEEFLIYRSKQNLKFKFSAAVEHNMEELKKKCISEMKTVEDIQSVLPENHDVNPAVWRELMDHCITLYKNKK